MPVIHVDFRRKNSENHGDHSKKLSGKEKLGVAAAVLGLLVMYGGAIWLLIKFTL